MAVDITERQVVNIIHDLIDADLLRTEKQGRRNAYSVNADASFRHPMLSHIKLGQFEDLLRTR